MAINEGDLLASLSRLENMLHGGGVEKSQNDPDSEELEKAQIVRGGGSSKGNLNDMHPETYGDSWDDGISGDGTDYKGRGKKATKAMRSGGSEKTSKEVETEEQNRMRYGDEDEGEEEEEEEKSLPEPGASGNTRRSGHKEVPGDPKVMKGNVDDEDDEGMKKTFSRPRASVGPGIRRSIEIEEDGEVHKGVEVSDFIFYLKKSVADAFQDLSYRVHDRINAHHASRGEFAKATAQAVAGISRSLSFSEDYVEEEEAAPAHAAKSVTREQEVSTTADLQKSLAKSQEIRAAVLGEMQDLLEKGSEVIVPMDIIKYEGGEEPRPQVRALLKSLG